MDTDFADDAGRQIPVEFEPRSSFLPFRVSRAFLTVFRRLMD